MINRTLEDYIKVAIIRNNFRSKREFCRSLGLSPNITTAYNNGTLPNDDTMIKIARLAGIDEETALLELAIWRNSGPAQKAFASILQKLTTACLLIAMVSALSSPALAAEKCKEQAKILYIMETSAYYF
tara:strand:- start:2834 stop:3220 length:387 start_codon:yes stop_codon:yes gene_type:complete